MAVTIAHAIDAFLLDAKTRGLRPLSLVHYERQLNAFRSYADGCALTTLDQVDTQTIRQYVVAMQDRGLRAASIRTTGRVLRAWLNFCARDELFSTQSPMRHVRLPPAPKPNPDAFTPDELRAISTAAAAEQYPLRARTIVLCLLDTGCRVGEFTQLRRCDVDLATGAVVIRHETSKTRTQRTVYLGKATRAALAAYLAEQGPAATDTHIWLGKVGVLTVAGMKKAVRRICARAGQNAGAHKFRRTFATLALRDGMDVKTTAAILGHSVDELLKSYVQSDEAALRAAHALHGPVDNLLK